MSVSRGDGGPQGGALADTAAVVALVPGDAGDCLALSAAAGWQHGLADWRLRLREGQGFGIREEGRLVAVALLLAYPGRAAFMGMLITAPDCRGRGLGARLSRHCIDRARDRGLPCCLIAVPGAVALYRRLGMEPVPGEGLVSFRGEVRVSLAAPAAGLRPARDEDLGAISALDAAALGYDRAAMLAESLERGAAFAWVAQTSAGEMAGYALGIGRGDTISLGPVLAADAATGMELVRAQISGLPPGAAIRLDVPLGQSAAIAEFESWGLTRAAVMGFMSSRPVRGLPYARPDRVVAAYSAIAG